MKTFYLSSAPEFYGDVTEEQSEAIGTNLAYSIQARFGDDIDVVLVRNSRDNSEADPDGEIQHWVNDNWADYAGEVVA